MDKAGSGENLTNLNVTVRAMMAADIDEVAAIHQSVFDSNYISYSEIHLGLASSLTQVAQESALLFRQELLVLLQEAEAQCFVVIIGSSIVGFAIVRVKQGANSLRECWLEDMGINISNISAANALYQKVLEWAQLKHCKYIFFESNAGNARLHRVCLRYGFKPICTIFGKELES